MRQQSVFFRGVINPDFVVDRIVNDLITHGDQPSSRYYVLITGVSSSGKTFLSKFIKDMFLDALGDTNSKALIDIIHLDEYAKGGDGVVTDLRVLGATLSAVTSKLPVITIVEGLSDNLGDVAEKLSAAATNPKQFIAFVTEPDPIIPMRAAMLYIQLHQARKLDSPVIEPLLKLQRSTAWEVKKTIKSTQLLFLHHLRFACGYIWIMRNVVSDKVTSPMHEMDEEDFNYQLTGGVLRKGNFDGYIHRGAKTQDNELS